jgi:hypothetical protein
MLKVADLVKWQQALERVAVGSPDCIDIDGPARILHVR